MGISLFHSDTFVLAASPAGITENAPVIKVRPTAGPNCKCGPGKNYVKSKYGRPLQKVLIRVDSLYRAGSILFHSGKSWCRFTSSYTVVLIVFIALLVFFTGNKAQAATKIASVSGNWNNTATWGGFAAPTISDDIIINAGITVTMNVCGTCRSILDMGSGALITGANSLVISNIAGIVATGPATISCPVNLANNSSVTVSVSLAISGVISGASITISKNGAGTLIVNGVNVFPGSVTVSSGILNVQNSSAFGTTAGGVAVSSGASLELEGGITVGDEALSIGGEGIPPTNSNGALFNAGGNNTWQGLVTITALNTRINSNSGSLTLSGNINLQGNTLYLQGMSTSNNLISGIISAAGTLQKVGTGRWTLSGTNTFSGGVLLLNGKLNINNPNALGISTNSLNLGGVGNSVTIDNTSGSSIATLAYPMNWFNDFTFSGTNDLNLGTGAVSMPGTRLVTVSAGVLTVGGIISGTGSGLTKIGNGRLTLGNNNTYNGITTVTAGELRLNPAVNSTPASQFVLNGGILSTTGITAGRTITSSSTLRLTDNSSLNLGANSHSLSFAISSAVGWTSDKILTINGWTGTFGLTGTGGKIFCGTTSAGLSASQLAQVRFSIGGNLYPATILSNGEVVPVAGIIYTGNIVGPFCAEASVLVPFTYVLPSNFPPGVSVFTAQLSNALGLFTSPVNLQGVVSNGSGTQSINAFIPAGTPAGNAYKIRVVSINPAVTGTDNGVGLIINVLPAAATGANRAICFGNSTQIGAVAVAGSAYNWTSVPAGFTSTSANPSVSPTVTTTYTLTETITATGCSKSNSMVVTVNPLPAANAGVNQTICPGNSTQIGAASVAGNTYSWSSVPAGFNSALANPVVSPSVTTTYTLTETITATACSKSNSVVVTVHPLPTVVSPGSQIYCSGASTPVIPLSGTPLGVVFDITGGAPIGLSNQTAVTSIPSFTAITGSATVAITPRANGCTGNPVSITITVLSAVSPNECFSPGAYIIDMGQPSPQTIPNGLKPYGLVYALIKSSPVVPVKWAINSSKTKDGVDFTLPALAGGKSYKAGSFIIPAENISTSVLALISTWKGSGVVVDGPVATAFTAPVYKTLTIWPKAFLDQQNDPLITPYFSNAGIPSSSYVLNADPSMLPQCGSSSGTQDVYILPHADPDQWPTAWTTALRNFINNGGSMWAGCHAVSVMENIAGCNFLSNSGLVPFGDHSDGTPPYTYTDPGNPLMQFMGTMDGATLNGSEQIYVPGSSGWRSTTTVAIYDPSYKNTKTNITYPASAGILVYGPAFGNSSNGVIMYEAGHELTKGNVDEQVAAQRSFFDFLLMAGGNPQSSITPPMVANQNATTCSGISFSVTPSGMPANTVYTWLVPSGTGFTGGAAQTTGQSSISGTLTNITSGQVTAIYTVTPAIGGCIGLPFTLTVKVNPLPTISFSPANPAFCLGSSISITASGAASYTWSPSTGLSATTGSTVIANPAVTTVYTVTGVDVNGCVNSKTVTVTVNTSTVTAGASPNPLCVGSTLNLTSSNTFSSSVLLAENFNGVTNSWTKINNSTGGTPANAAWTLRANGYITNCSGDNTALHTNDNSQFYLSNSCAQGSGGITHTILQSPAISTIGYSTLSLDFYHYFYFWSGAVATVDVSTNGSTWTTLATYTTTQGSWTAFSHPILNLNAYVGNATFYIRFKYDAPWSWYWAIDNVSITGTANSPVSWTGPSGFTSAVQNPSISNVTLANAGVYTVTYVDPVTSCSSSSSVNVSVDPLPTIAITPSSPSICIGSSKVLTASGAATYTWSPATGLSGTTGATVTANPLSTTTYSVIGTNVNGCINTTTVTITVNALPTISVTPASATICSGSGISLTASGASIYSWTPATGLSATTGATVTASPVALTTYTVTGTDVNSCSNTATAVISIKPTPATTGVNICPGGTGSLTSSSTCPDGNALTTGPTNAGLGANIAGVGTKDWSNPNNSISNDGSYAIVDLKDSNPTISRYLRNSIYNFSSIIPPNATIAGITVTIGRYENTGPGGGTNVRDVGVSLLKAGVIVGDNKANTTTDWPTSVAAAMYGGASDLWGTTWTYADIVNANFGVSLYVSSVNDRKAYVDYMLVTITYTVPGTLNWYTASSGGTLLGSGTPFNPVGVAGSGLPNTNTPGTYTFYAECSSVPGCRAATNFVINSAPVILVQPLSQTVCPGASATFSVTASGSPAPTYQWRKNGNPVGGATLSTYVINPITAGNLGSYDVIVSNSCGSVTSGLAVLSFPAVLNPGAHNTTPLTECAGYNPAQLTFTTPVSGGLLPYTYQWQLNNAAIPGETGTAFNPPQLTIPGVYSYNCAVTDACGTTGFTIPKVITIVADPSVFVSGGGVICQNDPVTLSANISGGAGTFTYQWQSGPTPSGVWSTISGATFVAYLPPTSAAGTVYYRILVHANGSGCDDPICTPVAVTVNARPVCYVSGLASVYAGSVNTVYASTVNPSDNVIHAWSISSNGIITGPVNGASVTVTAGTAGTFTLTDSISRFGCKSACTFLVMVIDLPCSITPAAPVANGTSTIYSAPAAMDTYSWSISGNGTITSSANSQSVTVLAGNNCNSYTLTVLLTKNGASSSCSQTITVTDNQPPTFTPPSLATGYCVEGFIQAIYHPGGVYPITDLTPDRRDYYILAMGNNLLDLNNIADNCLGTIGISWTIDFGNNGSPDISGNGQISLAAPIYFPLGDNLISWIVADANGNIASYNTILKVLPRPELIMAK